MRRSSEKGNLMKLINAGSLNYDTTYYVEHIVRPGETIAADRTETACGGKGLNQSIAAASAGAAVYHAGIVGEDGADLIQAAKERGVNTAWIRTLSGRASGRAVILLDRSGQNSIIVYAGTNHAFDREYRQEILTQAQPGDLLLLQNEINDVPELAAEAKEKGMQIVWNPSPFVAESVEQMMPLTDFLFINEVEGGQLTGETEPLKTLDRLKNMEHDMEVVLTLGEAGAYYQDKETRIFQKSYPVKTEDTTAAGDTFTGYYLAEKMSGKRPEDCLKIACAAAALAVTRKGAAPSIPVRKEVVEFFAFP